MADPTEKAYLGTMTGAVSRSENEELQAEAQALAAAIAASDQDPRTVPHERVRVWLQKLADGKFDAPAPEPE